MPDADIDDSRPSPELDRAKQLFRFLRAFAERNIPLKRELSDQPWSLALADLPNHPSVEIGEVDITDSSGEASNDDGQEGEPLLRVRRPVLTKAPKPPSALSGWLEGGWENPNGQVEVFKKREVLRSDEAITVTFDDDADRVRALASWRSAWSQWAETERPARAAMRIFERLYELRGRIERESERVELILGDGRLRWRRSDGLVDHPVLLQRVELEFDADVPEFRVVDADRAPELYGALLQGDERISAEQLNQLRIELEKGGYHPLASAGTSGFLRRLVQLLGPRGVLQEVASDQMAGADPVLMRGPVLFLRARLSGYPAAFERVLEDLERRGELPVSLTRLVGVTPHLEEHHVEAEASPWNEPPDVLLSKPANAEQVAIARALERHKAVLVQGPPGTGKSHTIANLIGHLVAQGKRILVTSHATKALRVLRGQIVDALQPLCVAVLEQDMEARKQLEQSVRDILMRVTTASEEGLEREITGLAKARSALNARIASIAADLRATREGEYDPIIMGGESTEPADAARWVRDADPGTDWIPGPLEPGAPLPLAEEELVALYATNGTLTLEEEAEIQESLPDPTGLLSVEQFEGIIAVLATSEPRELHVFWERDASAEELPIVERFHSIVQDTVEELRALQPWQRAVVAAGYTGGSESSIWTALRGHVVRARDRWDAARPLLLDNPVELPKALEPEDARECAVAISEHVEHGGSLGRLSLLFKPMWKRFLDGARVNGKRPSSRIHFRAIVEALGLDEERRELAAKWSRLAEPAGLPAFSDVPAPLEATLYDYVTQFDQLLAWWNEHWKRIASASEDAGFRWKEFRDHEVARTGPMAPFDRDMAILAESLPRAVEAHLTAADRDAGLQLLAAQEELLEEYDGPACSAMLRAVRDRDAAAYAAAATQLRELAAKYSVWSTRVELLSRVGAAAPAWANSIRRREGVHGGAALPADVATVADAWRWRQLHQEISRRASLDERVLVEQLEYCRKELRETTAQLIDRRAWLAQLRRTDLDAKQALQGWADTTKKIGRGTGKRAPALQAKARELLVRARDAVPVWIMPLARVAESFDPRQGRFDVVIVDEASQSDVTGLLAWYLGDQVAVVGDHEQVSPLAVGQQLEAIGALIAQHIPDIPNSHLYDGQTSVYELARQCFGGTIALREHFRCVPNIIEFSNWLSYNGEIRPLRDPGSAPMPHVVEYVIDGRQSGERTGKRNHAEARAIAALAKAVTELPQYEGKSVGAITLLGDEQAGLIQDVTVGLVGAVELEHRRFVAGNSAQFQGDERDVVFISMVDTPTGGLLALRQTDAFKQRYNVAASRARDQLWLVHSLDPNRDLKSGDLRRSLIEHVRDPGARQREMQRIEHRAESPFEAAVIQRLVAKGYRVEPQVWVGRSRIDMVVSDNTGQVAVECDGARFHGVDKIPEDMARQAVLERAGWRFIRIRSTRFFSDPEETMEWVYEELERRGVYPSPATDDTDSRECRDESARVFRDTVVRRAHEIMREQGWMGEDDAQGNTLFQNL